MDAIKLTTFSKPKYCEQIVAIDNGPGRLNMGIFDAVEVFMTDDTWAERQRGFPQAKEFAERFVAQMNAAALNPVT